jgi:hypothetical protein
MPSFAWRACAGSGRRSGTAAPASLRQRHARAPLRWRARRATSWVCIGCDGFGRLRESALRRVLLTIRGHLTEAGAAVTDARQQPRTPVNGRCELTGPGRKPQEPATRAGCSDSVPHTPCPCGLSAVHAPVGQQAYLQPSWGERAPNRPPYLRPSSLPRSPRGFASSSSRSFRKGTLAFVSVPHQGRFDNPAPLARLGVPSVVDTAGEPRAQRGAERRARSFFGAQPALTTRGAACLLSTNRERPRRSSTVVVRRTAGFAWLRHCRSCLQGAVLVHGPRSGPTLGFRCHHPSRGTRKRPASTLRIAI